ncbi:hypothetical protein [Luteibacter sp. E-22]|uniref:hypothetical protein n=1 Tax=Luteibacter sp. E-22 TaxID=3404050 RepID=UPI003CECE8E0
MSRPDQPIVFWKHYAYGYESRLTPYGRTFAIARMVRDVPGVHYELLWIYGPRRWQPFQVFNLTTIQRMVDRWVECHRDSVVAKMPPDPMRPPRFLTPTVEAPKAPDLYDVRVCPGCGRTWGMCDQTISLAAKKRGNFGWRCYRMAG